MRKHLDPLLLTGIVLWLTSCACAKGPVRRDFYGDPLPPRALVRLGTTRFRFPTSALLFSPDARMLAAVSPKDEVQLWEVPSGKAIHRLKLGRARAENAIASLRKYAMAFAPDGKSLLTGSLDGWVQLWDPATGKERRTLARGLGEGKIPIGAVAFSANGKEMIAVTPFGTVHVWSARGKTERNLELAPQLAIAIALSPDTRFVAVVGGAQNGAIALCSRDTGKRLHRLQTKDAGTVVDLAFSPSGKILVSMSSMGPITLWDTATGKNLGTLDVKDPNTAGLVFSPDGKILAGCGDRVSLWDVASRKLLRRLGNTFSTSGAVAFSPDGKLLAWGNEVIHLHDRVHDRPIGEKGDHSASVSITNYSLDGKYLITSSSDQTIRVWDAATGRPLRRLDGFADRLVVFTYSPGGRYLVAGERKGTVQVWDAATARSLLRHETKMEGQRWGFFSPDGRTLAVSSHEAPSTEKEAIRVRFFDMNRRRLTRTLEFPGQWTGALTAAIDGRFLALGSAHGHIEIRELTHGRVARSIPTGEKPLRILSFSADGSVLASFHQKEPGCRLWEVASGKLIGRILETQETIGTLFDLQSSMIAVARDNVMVFWSLQEQRQTGRLEMSGPISDFSWAPDGKAVVVSCYDTNTLVWDITDFLPSKKRRAPVLTAAQLAACWEDLHSDDAGKAYRAGWKLSAAPAQALPFLKTRLKPVAPVARGLIARLIADMDSDTYAVREKAFKQLRALGEQVEPELWKALEGNSSPEVRRRARKLLGYAKTLSLESLRGLRTLYVLERVGSPEALRLLRELAGGAAAARLTQEAKAALERRTLAAHPRD